MITKDNLLQENASISILEVETYIVKAVSTMNNILASVTIHFMIQRTLYQAICVALVAEVILIPIFCSVQIQTMGLRTLMVIIVKITLMVMQNMREQPMEIAKITMMIMILFLKKFVVIVVAA